MEGVSRVDIWQYHAVQKGGDGWRFMYSENPNVGRGWTRDTIIFHAFSRNRATPRGAIPIYEYHAVQSDGDGWRFHYSDDANVGRGWTNDGIAWWAFPDKVAFKSSISVSLRPKKWRWGEV